MRFGSWLNKSLVGAIFLAIPGAAQAQFAQPSLPRQAARSALQQSELDQLRRATVSIGQVIIENGVRRYITIGSGIMVSPNGKDACVLTAKHVVSNPQGGYVPTETYVRLPQEFSTPAENFGSSTALILNGVPLWKSLPDNSDLAVFPLPVDLVNKAYSAIPSSSFGNESDVFQGATILVLGYPVLLGEEFLSTPLARGGIISWVDPIAPLEKPFLVDANVFNGNSGGPVFHTPNGTTKNGGYVIGGSSKIIGIVSKDAAESATVYAGGVPVQSIDQSTGKVVNLEARVLNIGGIGIIEPIAKAKRLVETCVAAAANSSPTPATPGAPAPRP